MTVDIQCEGCGGVAKVPLNCLDVIAGANGGNGEGVTQIVEAGIRVEVLIDTKERKMFAGKISLFVEESDNFIIQALLSLLSKWDPISLMY